MTDERPLFQSAPSAPRATTLRSTDALKTSLHPRILVVDDDAEARNGLGSLLRGEGFVVEVAEDGAAALVAVRACCPDVVLTDLNMPNIDGLELCRTLRVLEPDLPVVVASAGDTPAAIRAMKEGAGDYLTKPLDLDAVLISIRHAIEERAAKVEQKQLRLRNEQLYQEALSAVRTYEDIVSIVSHDLRSPLGVICLQAQLLKAEGSASSMEAVDRILRSATRMEHLIRDLLDESRIRNGHLQLERAPHPLAELLEDVSELRPLALQKGVRLAIQQTGDALSVSCDRPRIAQVLDNLVTNAIKFSERGSTVSLSAGPCNDGVSFAIHNDGVGITAEAQPHIFDRFWQTSGDGRRAGVGLGLFIAKGILDAHGGRIWVESEPGFGTTFHVVLPRT